MNSTYNLNDQFSYKIHPNQNIVLPVYSENGVAFNIIRNAEVLNILQIESTLNSLQKAALNS